MTAPTCSIHGTPMNAGNKGGWYCPKKMPDGTYCKQRAKDAPQDTQDAPVAPSTSQPAGSPPRASLSPKGALLIACLEWSGKIFQGSCQPDDAKEAALSLFTDISERAK